MDPRPATGTFSALSKDLSNRIAPGIYDAVIDNLHSDKPTLKKCARVCKSWISASRYHLVQRAKLHPAQIGRFCELVEPSVSTFPQQFVHLEMRHAPPLWTPWEQSMVPSSKPRLPGMRLDKSAHLIRLLPRFTALSSVEFVNVNFTSFGQLADIMCVLPVLERVMLEAVTWVDDEFDVATLIRPLGVKNLSMHCWDNTHIINWLISREQLPLIKKLSLSGRTTSGGELLKVLGSSLESLELRLAVYQPDPEGIFVNSIDLSHYTNLRSLDLDFLASETKILSRPGSEASILLKFLLEIGGSQNTCNVEELTFCASAEVIRFEFGLEFWKDVAEVLGGPVFAYFRKVEICVGHCGGDESEGVMEEWIRLRLKGCHDRGILRVTFRK